ncbi:polysaccharide pyruvyl transferase family protein [Micrococcus lylae]|uniref:polysaccharide pyruvyl transferase family protein n=1 Tax=Micrococcus lylae TaxID=1273 RepID=UPI000C80E760|nr:polysaccharide pyruvyl transferase family protein [Micrococcus lylae]WIK82659.1 polysaccharide pyruvyl transferase family protein [Micrococcus lylae]
MISAEPTAASAAEPRRVTVVGYYGARNLGDDLLLSAIHEGLRRADPQVRVQVAAEHPQHVAALPGLSAHSRLDHAATFEHVRRSDALVLGGGGLWHDYSFERAGGLLGFVTAAKVSMPGYGIPAMLAEMLGVPVHVLGIGAGPIRSEDAARAVRAVARTAETLTVRDEDSARILEPFAADLPEVRLAPDLVYSLSLPDGGPSYDEARSPAASVARAREAGRAVVAVNLRSWADGDMARLRTRLAAALAAVATTRPLTVVTLPFQAGPGRDAQALAELTALLPEDVERIDLAEPPPLAELTALLRGVDAVVAMRLHACLLAHRCGTPTVGLDYDPKVGRHFREADRASACLPLDADAAALEHALRAALDGPLPSTCVQRIRDLEAQSRAVVDDVARRIVAAGIRPRPRDPAVGSAAAAAALGTGAVGGPAAVEPAAFSGMVLSDEKGRLTARDVDRRTRARADRLSLAFPESEKTLAAGRRLGFSGVLTAAAGAAAVLELPAVPAHDGDGPTVELVCGGAALRLPLPEAAQRRRILLHTPGGGQKVRVSLTLHGPAAGAAPWDGAAQVSLTLSGEDVAGLWVAPQTVVAPGGRP